MEGQVGAGVIAHGHWPDLVAVEGPVSADPVTRLIVHRVLGEPHVAGIDGGRRAGDSRVEVEGQEATIRMPRVGLVQDRAAACGVMRSGRVVEAQHTRKGAEVAIERPVLLHEDDHVLDPTGLEVVGRRLAQGLTQRRGKDTGASPMVPSP